MLRNNRAMNNVADNRDDNEYDDDEEASRTQMHHNAFISTEAPQLYTPGCPMFLSASSTRMDTFVFIHKWNIGQFSVHNELSQHGDALESKVFGSSDGNYLFKLKLFPGGKDEECKGFLSLFLQIMKCPMPKLRFRVNFYLDTTDGPRGCALNKNVVSINKGGLVTASKFYSMETLKNRPAVYLPNDTLTIGVELTVFGDMQSLNVNIDDGEEEALSPKQEQLETWSPGSGSVRRKANSPIPVDNPGPSSTPARSLMSGNESVGDCLTTLFKSEAFADIDVVVPKTGRVYKCHKAILAARSSFFHAMFSHSETTENVTGTVKLDDITPEVVYAVLYFIYSGKCDFNSVAPAELLAAADRFCLEALKRECELALMKNNTLENVCSRLRLADMYHAERLRQRALLTIFRNQNTVLQSEEWGELERQCPALAAATLKRILTMPEPFARRCSGSDDKPSHKRSRRS
uniref:BTB domain-containing protein n=1 Tax=Steinernema glaseri TaxID=37863 RepID=A0A1I8AB10_9BILA